MLTFGGAITFLCVKAFEWTTEISHGYTITANTFWSFYYTAAGLHALHVIAGIDHHADRRQGRGEEASKSSTASS